MSQFEFFELVLLLKLDKQFPVEQFDASRAFRGSSISVSKYPPPLLTTAAWLVRLPSAERYLCRERTLECPLEVTKTIHVAWRQPRWGTMLVPGDRRGCGVRFRRMPTALKQSLQLLSEHIRKEPVRFDSVRFRTFRQFIRSVLLVLPVIRGFVDIPGATTTGEQPPWSGPSTGVLPCMVCHQGEPLV